MSGDLLMNTLIIGNGIIALSIAFRLTETMSKNDRLIIVGDESRFGSATNAAGAMLNSFAEIEEDSLDSEIDLIRFEMSHLATQMWPKFEKDIIGKASSNLPDKCKNCQGINEGGCAITGTYIVNNTAADDLDDSNYDAILSALKEFNEQHFELNPKDIEGYKPHQDSRATRAVYIPNEGWYNPRLMLEKLDAYLALHPQVKFINQRASRIYKNSCNQVEYVELNSKEKLSADKFVLATGASVTEILQNSNLQISVPKIFYGVGVSLEVKPHQGHIQKKCIRTPNRGLACGIYSVPYFNGPDESQNILLGASNFISQNAVPNPRASSVSSIIEAGIKEINDDFYKSGVVRVNMGWRPVSADTYPIIGPTSIPNFMIVSGTKRDGFHLAPLISEIIVKALYEIKFDPRYDVFLPERKLIKTLSRETAIKKSIRHLMSAHYQHGYRPSPGRMNDLIKTGYSDFLNSLHDKVGAYDWGIPPELIDMYQYGHIEQELSN